jgi:hypothetical protein
LTGLQPERSVLTDKAYDANWIRDMIWEQRATDIIPSKANRKRPKQFLITHEPQPISAGGRAWAVFGRWPRSGGGSWLRDRSAC